MPNQNKPPHNKTSTILAWEKDGDVVSAARERQLEHRLNLFHDTHQVVVVCGRVISHNDVVLHSASWDLEEGSGEGEVATNDETTGVSSPPSADFKQELANITRTT